MRDQPPKAVARASDRSTATAGAVGESDLPARSLEDRLAAIARLDMSSLRSAWADQFGRPPPMNLSRRLLELAASYHVQAKFYGGLKPALRRRLLQAATSQSNPAA